MTFKKRANELNDSMDTKVCKVVAGVAVAGILITGLVFAASSYKSYKQMQEWYEAEEEQFV